MGNISAVFSKMELRMLDELQLLRIEQEKLVLTKSDILREALDLLYNKYIVEPRREEMAEIGSKEDAHD